MKDEIHVLVAYLVICLQAASADVPSLDELVETWSSQKRKRPATSNGVSPSAKKTKDSSSESSDDEPVAKKPAQSKPITQVRFKF